MTEIREDEDQAAKLGEITDLLVAAGYFRARIKGLSDFDKVVGGITWCIESCNYDVNINLLYHENLTIGQKIALTEKIVIMLPKMNCPHTIEPHQIQGLDYIHIFPIIQWLLKRSIEARRDIAGFVRNYVACQFDKTHKTNDQESSALKESKKCSKQHLESIKRAYEPRRQLKRDVPPESPIARARSVLFEYNPPNIMFKSQLTDKTDDKDAQEKVDTEVTPAEAGFKKFADSESLSANVVGKMINLQRDEGAENVEFDKDLNKLEDSDDQMRIYSAMEKKKALLEDRVQALREEHAKLEAKIAKKDSNLLKLRENLRIKQDSILQLSKMESEGKTSQFYTIKSLYLILMALKNQEQEFRDQCKRDAAQLQEMAKNNDSDTSEVQEYLTVCETIKKSIDKTKLTLAKKNRAIASLLRQLDDVPGRSELTQYQHRFMELYSQVAAKHKETKQYYTLYNTLYDTKLYLNKEFSILNSIQENYNEAMASVGGREEFLKQLETIATSVKRNKKKLEEKYAEEKDKAYTLNKKLVMIVEQQRKYVTAVKQLTVECRKNEALLAQLRGS